VSPDTRGEVCELARGGLLVRLHYIDVLLHVYGLINREALVEYFGVSVQQASLDISAYIVRAPGNIAYSTSRKAYLVTSHYQRAFV
jgi:hypothetical protein